MQCPDCKRKNKKQTNNGKQQCKKCLQFIIVEDGEPIKCMPKVFFI